MFFPLLPPLSIFVSSLLPPVLCRLLRLVYAIDLHSLQTLNLFAIPGNLLHFIFLVRFQHRGNQKMNNNFTVVKKLSWGKQRPFTSRPARDARYRTFRASLRGLPVGGPSIANIRPGLAGGLALYFRPLFFFVIFSAIFFKNNSF